MNKTVLMSGKYPVFVERLKKMDINIITTISVESLDLSISSHADCIMFSPDNKTFFIEKSNYDNIVNYLTRDNNKAKLIPIDGIRSPYPGDVKLNCKAFGKKILCNTTTVAKEIVDFAIKNDYELIHCNQGYASCSTVKINDNAAITDDESVYDTLKVNGIDCIKINKGSVRLDGYNYGFIGGCCGFINKNTLAFTGNIDKHSDSTLIKDFLNKHNINYISLADSELIDIGGIMQLNNI